MRFEVVIPTGWRLHRLEPLTTSLRKQTILPEKITFLLYLPRDEGEIQNLRFQLHRMLWDLQDRVVLVHHKNSEFVPWYGVAYDRKFLLSNLSSPFVYMIDDDNTFAPNFFAETIVEYKRIEQTIGRPCMMAPTVMRKDTWQVQAQGTLWMRSPAVPMFRFVSIATGWKKVVCMWWNAWFGPRDIFGRIRHDIRMRWSYEDMTMSYSLTQQGIPFIVSADVHIAHQEEKKSRAELIFMGSPQTAYARWRNRIFFAQLYYHGRARRIYYLIGLPLQTIYFAMMILLYTPDKINTLRAMRRGTRHGLQNYAPTMSDIHS